MTVREKLKIWVQAFRLRTLPLAFSCIGMGGFLAAYYHKFDLQVFLLSILTTLFLQILSNLANDYGDSIHGADGAHRKGPSRAVQQGFISRSQMKLAIVVFSLLSLISGILLLITALKTQFAILFTFLVLGICSIIAAITYTNGKRPYGYAGLGDISVLIFFGMAGVLGSFYLHTLHLAWHILLPAISCGLFAVAVLNVNNIRDIESDKQSGKFSLPVRLGREKAVIYHGFLLSTGIISALIFTAFIPMAGLWKYSFLLVTPLLYFNFKAVKTKKEPSDLDPYLKQMALTTLLFALLFGFGLLLT